MSLLNINNPFTMTIEEGEETKDLRAFFRDFTKAEKREFDKKNKKIKEAADKSIELTKQMRRSIKSVDLKEKQGDFEGQEAELTKLYALEDELDALNKEFNESELQTKLIKERFELCLGGKDADEIMALAETVGYDRVLKVIQESIVEENAGKQKK